MLDVKAEPEYDNSITEYEFRTHAPFTSTTFNPNDEVRILIQQQESVTYPCESYIHITGTLTKGDAEKTVDGTLQLINNAIAFLFDEIRFELSGVVISRSKNVGITSTLRNLLCMTPNDEPASEAAGWFGVGKKTTVSSFSFCIPVKMMLSFFEDYKRAILNQRQELIILLSNTRKNSIFKNSAIETTDTAALTISNISWKMPYIKVSDVERLPLLKILNEDEDIQMPFRNWELHEYPTVPTSTRQSWTIKTSSQMEKPRYVILAFQTGRKNKLGYDPSVFDLCQLSEVKLYLNSQYYPYDNLRGDLSLMYNMYLRFQSSYWNGKTSQPLMSKSTFDKCPIIVIDCSKQNEILKSGPVDVRLEFEASTPFADNTTAYCLIIHDSLVKYKALSGIVTRMQ